MKLRKKREESRWEQVYENQAVETLPWYYPGLDPDFSAALERYGIHGGEVLDLCTGPGTKAMALAERGFNLDRTFDLVFDSGCFHVFPRDKRRDYVPAISRLINPGGYLMLKCFSHLETRPEGPYRIAPSEIEKLFSTDFEIMALQHTTFTGQNLKSPPKALLSVLRKR
ncbi:MAG: methyltransferase domain-containing protein [Thermoleophilia bacterium]